MTTTQPPDRRSYIKSNCRLHLLINYHPFSSHLYPDTTSWIPTDLGIHGTKHHTTRTSISHLSTMIPIIRTHPDGISVSPGLIHLFVSRFYTLIQSIAHNRNILTSTPRWQQT